MSVICAPAAGAAGAPSAAVGATPRRSGRLASLLSRSGSQQDGGAGGNVLFVKGAAECVLQRCTRAMLADGSIVPLDAAARRELHGCVGRGGRRACAARGLGPSSCSARSPAVQRSSSQPSRTMFLHSPRPRSLLDRLAGRALRLLACAVKTDLGDLADYDGTEAHRAHKRLADPSQYAALESDLVFLGLAGLQDPPRPEVRDAIQDCHAAGERAWAGAFGAGAGQGAGCGAGAAGAVHGRAWRGWSGEPAMSPPTRRTCLHLPAPAAQAFVWW